MDIFAVGCILSELYTDTKPLLGYKDLLSLKDGVFSVEKKLDTIREVEISNLLKKMLSTKPEERGELSEHLEYFKKFFSEEMFSTLIFMNYAFRRSEFSHPDIKLGLIRLMSTYLCKLAQDLAADDTMKEIAQNIVFKKYFPY